MTDPRVLHLIGQLRASRLSDLEGARISASIPVSERLLNQVAAGFVPANAPVREVSVHPRAGNRLGVRARVARAAFLPPVTINMEIERQAVLPDGPLVVRILTAPGLVSLLGAAFPLGAMLPPGIILQDQRLLVDVRALIERQGYGELLPYLESIRVTTEPGRLLVDVALRVWARDPVPAGSLQRPQEEGRTGETKEKNTELFP